MIDDYDRRMLIAARFHHGGEPLEQLVAAYRQSANYVRECVAEFAPIETIHAYQSFYGGQ